MGKFDLSDDDRAKATRKPLPKTLRAWMAEIEGVQGFVKQRVTLKDAQGKQWYETMRKYYRARLLALSENPPPLLPAKAAVIIVREIVKTLST